MSPSEPCILLDLDGTLIDSQPGILASCHVALRALGHAPDPSRNLTAFIGPPIDEGMRFLLEPFGDDRVAEAVAIYRAEYSQRGLYNSHLYAGVADALAELRRAGARLYLATSKRKDFALRILEHLDLASQFDGICGAEQSGALAGKPELIAHIVERYELAPQCCVMVGDRRYDILGAHANQMRALGALWGYGARAELESAGADGLVAEPAHLPMAALAAVSHAV